MASNRMIENDNSVVDFIEKIDHERKKKEAYQLLEIFEKVTGYEAKMWGASIIGFGTYHYKYESGHEGDAPLAGFSPRKAKISLYLDPERDEREELLGRFGKHTTGKSCIYVNKLADIDLDVLEELIEKTVEKYKKLYPEE
jgi:hypothetical protein